MLNKEYIESLLKDEEIFNKILTMRPQFTHTISEFYFFNIFFRVLKSLGFEINHRKESNIIDNKIVMFCFIDFLKDGKIYTTQYDNDKLQYTLNEFNDTQPDMSMRGSTSVLIGIFLSLLV